ncbi:hypothetical protein ACHAWF_005828 [Thalassiosira exigua]
MADDSSSPAVDGLRLVQRPEDQDPYAPPYNERARAEEPRTVATTGPSVSRGEARGPTRPRGWDTIHEIHAKETMEETISQLASVSFDMCGSVVSPRNSASFSANSVADRIHLTNVGLCARDERRSALATKNAQMVCLLRLPRDSPLASAVVAAVAMPMVVTTRFSAGQSYSKT